MDKHSINVINVWESFRKQIKDSMHSIWIIVDALVLFVAKHTNVNRLCKDVKLLILIHIHFFCSWCGKGFMCNQKMGIHERIHTGQTPYQCNDCGKRFKQSIQLKSHMRIHTGETPYQCEKCCKKFKFASTKSNHKCVLNS